MKVMHTSGRRSPRRDQQEARRTGPGTRRLEFLDEHNATSLVVIVSDITWSA